MSIETKIDFTYAYKKLMAETQELVKEYYRIPSWKEDLLQYLMLKAKEQEEKINDDQIRRRVFNELYDVIQ